MSAPMEVHAAVDVRGPVGAEAVEVVRRIVDEEVGPTVVALRGRAAEVVEMELARLAGRLPGLEDRVRAEAARTVRRVVDTLLHAPTVRVRERAAYAAMLRTLFDLDPPVPEAVTRADRDTRGAP